MITLLDYAGGAYLKLCYLFLWKKKYLQTKYIELFVVACMVPVWCVIEVESFLPSTDFLEPR